MSIWVPTLPLLISLTAGQDAASSVLLPFELAVPAVISEGNTPGAIELTRMCSFMFAISVASILVTWIVAALAALLAKWLREVLMRPLMLLMLITQLWSPGCSGALPRASRGRKAVVTK